MSRGRYPAAVANCKGATVATVNFITRRLEKRTIALMGPPGGLGVWDVVLPHDISAPWEFSWLHKGEGNELQPWLLWLHFLCMFETKTESNHSMSPFSNGNSQLKSNLHSCSRDYPQRGFHWKENIALSKSLVPDSAPARLLNLGVLPIMNRFQRFHCCYNADVFLDFRMVSSQCLVQV